MELKILILTFVISRISAENFFTFNNTWAKLGGPAELKCQQQKDREPNDQVKICTWFTPYGEEYLMLDGFTEEKQRLHGVLNADECVLKITKTEAKDQGLWKCQARVGSHGGVNVEETAELKLAEMPEKIILEDPFDDEASNDTSSYDFKCIVDHTEPEPNFSWFVGEELLSQVSVRNENTDDFRIQVLSYVPQVEHSNETLRCLIDYKVHGLSDILEDSVSLRFTDDQLANIVDHVAETEDIFGASNATTTVVIVLVTVFGVCMAVFATFRLKNACFGGKPSDCEIDAEKAEKEPETEEATEKTDLTKEEEESTQEVCKKSTFGERFAAFFRLNVETSGQEGQEGQEDQVDQDGDDLEKTPEVVNTPVKEAETVLEIPEEKKTGNRIWKNFFSKMIKSRDVVADKSGEEPVKMSDCQDDEMTKKELEPEDKPEEEEKEPTPNTSF